MTRCANATGAGVTASHLIQKTSGFAINLKEVRS
jgi:hypothetical protein